MKIQSTRIASWGNACTVIGVIAIVVWLIAKFFGAPWGAGLPIFGFSLIIYAPILDGLAVLVRDAEDRIDARERAKEQAQKEEDDKQIYDWRAAQKRCKQENENTND